MAAAHGHEAKRVLVPIAEGSEDLETACLVNVLRRAKIHVDVASCTDHKLVTMARGMKFTADVLVSDVAGEKYDMIALPGGMPGAEHLSNNATLTRMLLEQKTAHRWIAAICASPAVVLAKHGILTPDTPATCYPGMTSKLPNVSTSGAPCVVSGRIITSRGPGTAMLYGLQCVSCLMGKDAAHSVAEGMLVDDSVLV